MVPTQQRRRYTLLSDGVRAVQGGESYSGMVAHPPVTLTEALASGENQIRILLVTPSPVNDQNRLQPEAELREIYGVLGQLRIDVDVIRLNPPTVENLRFALATRKFDIVHIATHGDASGIDFEEIDGRAIRLSVEKLGELFQGLECLLILNSCSTEPFGDELARVSPDVTTISIGGGVIRSAALRVIHTIYNLLFAGFSAERVAQEATRRLRELSDAQAEVRATGRNARSKAFNLALGAGRPSYYSCMPRTNVQPRHMPIFDREREIFRLHEALSDGGPYIGLVGITGNGKTTLIKSAVARYGWRFTDGIGYISLRTDLSLIKLAEIFDWTNLRTESTDQEISVRLSDGRYLLIFDDAEDASTETMQEILSLLNEWDTSLGGRAIIVLHTQRAEFVDVIGTNWIQVEGLPADAARELMESCLGSKEQAKKALGSDLEVIPDLCFGHPKTIESTASRLQLKERWSDVKEDLLRLNGQGPLSVNDEMMSRVIDRLEHNIPAVRELLDAWAVFEDRCRESAWREVAARRVGDPEQQRHTFDAALRALQGATLIERYDEDEEARCLMHPLLVSHLRRRHALLSREKLGDLVEAQLSLETSLASALRYPAEESGNVRRALKLARELQLWPAVLEYCDKVAGQSYLPLLRGGPWPLARDILDLAVEAASFLKDRVKEACFLMVRGMVEYRLAELSKAESAYMAASELSSEIDEDSIKLAALWGIGRVRYRMGDFDGARDIYLKAKAEAGDQDEVTVADVDHELGKVLYRNGELQGARELFLKAREVRERVGKSRDLARSLHELGRVEHAAGELAAARALYTEALELERQDNDPVTEQATLFQLGRLGIDEGRVEEAERSFKMSQKVTDRLGDKIWLAHAQWGRALLSYAVGDIESALEQARLALAQAQRLQIGLAAEIEEWVIGITSNDHQRKGQ